MTASDVNLNERVLPDVRARLQQLLDQVTVTNIQTGKPLAEMGKRGRVFAACRGHVPTLVTIDWGSTNPAAVKAALDELRGEPTVRRLSEVRARRFCANCSNPARASRASDRVHRLALRAQAREEYGLARDYFTLSTALNERRHALIQYRLSNGRGNEAYADHTREVQALLDRIGGAA